MPMRDFRQLFEIGYVAERIAHRFTKDRLGPVVDQLFECLRVTIIGEAHINAVLRQSVCKQVISAAVKRRGRHDVVTRLGDGHHGISDGGHAGSQPQCCDAAFQFSHTLFQHIRRRVHDARVNIALNLEVKQVCTMLGIVECIGCRLIDRHCNSFGSGVR